MPNPLLHTCYVCGKPSATMFGHTGCFSAQNEQAKEQRARDREKSATKEQAPPRAPHIDPAFFKNLNDMYSRLAGEAFRGPSFIPPPKPEAPRAIVTRLDQARIRQLLMLCHPDRHGNSETSSEVTRWLIDLKQQLEGGKKS